MKSQMNISALQVELDKVKNAYIDEKLQHERWERSERLIKSDTFFAKLCFRTKNTYFHLDLKLPFVFYLII